MKSEGSIVMTVLHATNTFFSSRLDGPPISSLNVQPQGSAKRNSQLCESLSGFPRSRSCSRWPRCLSDRGYYLTPSQHTSPSHPAMHLRLAYYCSGHGQFDTLFTPATTSHQGLSQVTATQRGYLPSHLLCCPSTRPRPSTSSRRHRSTFFRNP